MNDEVFFIYFIIHLFLVRLFMIPYGKIPNSAYEVPTLLMAHT